MGETIAWFIVASFALTLYMTPWIIALRRRIESHGFIFWLNLLFGFSGVAWLILLLYVLGEKENERFS